MDSKIIVWGIKGFYAHTPKWAQRLFLVLLAAYSALLEFMFRCPDVIPATIGHYLVIGAPFLLLACQAVGVKPPTDVPADPNPTLKGARTVLLLAMLLLPALAMGYVTKKDVKAAKQQYKTAKGRLSIIACQTMDDIDKGASFDKLRQDNEQYQSQRDVVYMDSLYWRGLKAVRHDQHVPKLLRLK